MSIKNAKGQMAIFFVLIFQVLFVLFAMTINVALVVHDKINFQNSLDLAALYGAKKQAEVLNALAHINYQMKQNYKLLAWRYRILGSMAIPYQATGHNTEAWCPGSSETSDFCSPGPLCPGSIYSGYCDKGFSVCMNASIWGAPGTAGSDYCKNNQVDIPRLRATTPIAIFLPWTIPNYIQERQRIEDFQNICRQQKGLSYLFTQVLLSHFRLDQKDRKIMMKAIFKESLHRGKDLDGHSINAGAEKVFKKNLSYSNYQNYNNSLSFFNSLEGASFEDFLNPLNIWPTLLYMDMDTDCSGRLVPHQQQPTESIELSESYQDFYNTFERLFRFNSQLSNRPNWDLQTLTLGYSKNPNFKVYYGIQTEISYQTLTQLFSPTDQAITLKGSAFAKPFGGRIGPTQTTDPLIRKQIEITSLASIADNTATYNLHPNYSRYPGDRWGLIDRKLHTGNTAFLKKTPSAIPDAPSPYAPQYLDHLEDTTRADPLSYADDAGSREGAAFHFLRLMELLAVFPNTFDIIHYSILNNYMKTYFPKICKLIGRNQQACEPYRRELIRFNSSVPAYIRGDFGYPESDLYFQRNLQVSKVGNSFMPFFLVKNRNPVNLNILNIPANSGRYYSTQNIRYSYLISDPAHLLTAWVPHTSRDRYEDYSTFPARMFAKCYESTDNPNPALKPIPSGCSVGGRSGYSIKLISCETVDQFSQQASNHQEYCPP